MEPQFHKGLTRYMTFECRENSTGVNPEEYDRTAMV